ncbi:MAG: UDP-N-acetylmuramoyl-L-alanyl-D-glutamate--2,6-diaminopimelate ligase [Sulfurovum sp.]
MLIHINNKQFTDNSNEANKDTIFVVSKHNEKFKDQALLNGCESFIDANQLKDHVDLSGIKIVGITGTNGKTTTAAAIYSFLLDLGYKVALQGTRGFFINDERVEDYSLTTPIQLGNFEHIYKAKENGCEFFIMEVSSHAIEQKRIEGLDFELKIHTNITRDHLDYHKTVEEYIAVKNSFFADESKKLINKDDTNIRFNSKNCLTYALDAPSTYKVDAFSFKEETHVLMNNLSSMYAYTSNLMGVFNIYNITAAVAAVHMLTNRDLEEICEVVEDFAGVSGRMEIISKDPFVIIDFAHTPDGMNEVLKSFSHKDIIVVFGAGGDRDKEKRAIMGKVASQFAKHIIVTSDNPRFEDPDLIMEDIVKGITKPGITTVEINRKAAIKKAIELYDDKSVILILGKGDEEAQIIYDQKLPFSDKKAVLELLK